MGYTTERVYLCFALFCFLNMKGCEKMKVNGAAYELNKSETLSDFLKSQNYNSATIVVELNGNIIPRTSYEEIMLYDEDTLEVLRFVGGG